MSDDNIFKTDDKTETKNEINDSAPIEQTASVDVSALQKRLTDKDDYIKKLEQENHDARLKLEKAKTIDEVLEKMKNESPKQDSSNKDIDIDRIRSLAEEAATRVISAKEQEHENLREEVRQADNAKLVSSALRKAFGDKAEEAFALKAQEIGEPVGDLNRMARLKPGFVLEMFGLRKETATAGNSTGTSGSLNSEAIIKNQKSSSVKFTEATKRFFHDPFDKGAFEDAFSEKVKTLKDI